MSANSPPKMPSPVIMRRINWSRSTGFTRSVKVFPEGLVMAFRVSSVMRSVSHLGQGAHQGGIGFGAVIDDQLQQRGAGPAAERVLVELVAGQFDGA